MATDWVEDSSLSADETLARFRRLKPEPTVGPKSTAGPTSTVGFKGTPSAIEFYHADKVVIVGAIKEVEVAAAGVITKRAKATGVVNVVAAHAKSRP